MKIEPGFTIGHEFVGTVLEAGADVTRVAPGDRVLGCFHSACGTCFFCLRGAYQKCERARLFGHGAALGDLQGTQAEQTLVPMANMTLRQVPDSVADDVALFAGDVMGTGYHAIDEGGVRARRQRRRARPRARRPVRGPGCAGRRRAQSVFAIDTVEERLEVARTFGATPVHLTEQKPARCDQGSDRGRGVDVAIDAVGHPDALDLAIRLARNAGTVVAIGVYAEPCAGAHGARLDQGAHARSPARPT